MKIEQGDILKVQRQPYPVIVVSNNFFNESGKAVVCPIRKDAKKGPLHLAVQNDQIEGYILCEQVHYLDLTQRFYTKICSVPYFDVMDLSDAVMSIFDYQMN
jgi:mRNA interferase MazF